MKKSIFVLFLLAGSFLTQAQLVVTTPNDSLHENITQTDEFATADIHIYVINTGNNNVTYTWELKNYQAPNGWGVAICDNNNCYDLLINAGPYESLAVSPGDTMDMKMQFAPYCIGGSGWSDVVIYVTGDSANTAVVLHYSTDLTANCPNGIATVSNAAMKVYPSPFQSSFTVSGLENSGNVSLSIYDLKGALVPAEVKNSNAGAFEIAMPQAAPGTYILKAVDAAGKMIASSTITKSE
ncbi:MAG: T9SS type A sorting domain-containing protein [Bacteroidetes bacterium]|nr:T9SS type A sorting domain-containing protein [Bacteroidota bacterium]